MLIPRLPRPPPRHFHRRHGGDGEENLRCAKRAILPFLVPLVPWWSAFLRGDPSSGHGEEDHHQGTRAPSRGIFDALPIPSSNGRAQSSGGEFSCHGKG